MADLTLGVADAAANSMRELLGVEATLTAAGAVTVSGLSQAFTTHATSGVLQPSVLSDSAAHNIQSGGDDFAPCNQTWLGSAEWIGGNHARLGWLTAKGSLTAADIGKVWSSGADRIMLYDVDETDAHWSYTYNDAVTLASGNAPTGTWTLGGAPDVDFTGTTLDQHIPSSVTVDTAVVWAAGSHPLLARHVEQRLIGWDECVTAQAASVGEKISVAGLTGIADLTSDWRWPGDQPGVTIIDVALTADEALTVNQWSGLQAAMAGSGTVALVGVTADHPFVTWGSAGTSTDADPARWADATPVSVGMTRNAYGGVAVGVLASSVDRSELTAKSFLVSAIGKLYPVAVGTGNGSLDAESVTTVRGFRSVTAETSDRHVHVVTDPVTGVTYWWLMAGSTGTSFHPALARHTGKRLTQTRGTAAVDATISADGVTVTTAGWAEGTIGW